MLDKRDTGSRANQMDNQELLNRGPEERLKDLSAEILDRTELDKIRHSIRPGYEEGLGVETEYPMLRREADRPTDRAKKLAERLAWEELHPGRDIDDLDLLSDDDRSAVASAANRKLQQARDEVLAQLTPEEQAKLEQERLSYERRLREHEDTMRAYMGGQMRMFRPDELTPPSPGGPMTRAVEERIEQRLADMYEAKKGETTSANPTQPHASSESPSHPAQTVQDQTIMLKLLELFQQLSDWLKSWRPNPVMSSAPKSVPVEIHERAKLEL